MKALDQSWVAAELVNPTIPYLHHKGKLYSTALGS